MEENDINNEQNKKHIKRKRLKSINYISKYKKFLFIPLIPTLVIILLTIILTHNATNEHFSGGMRTFWDSALNYTSEIPSVSFESDDWNNKVDGSWHLDKSAKWTGIDTAQVDFLIKTNSKRSDAHLKDIILVLDVSGSMEGEKLEKVKEDAKELVEALLSGTGNRVALVVFDTTAEVKSYFVDASGKNAIIGLINGLTAGGMTNYNDGLKKMETVIVHDNYTEKEGTDLIALFLTDGYPCYDTPNEIATATILKDTYPYLTINGISYETGIITEDLKKISDEQFYASKETLENILFEASLSPEEYENFQVVDYVKDDYFYVKDKENITVSVGKVELINESNGKQKIVWTLSPDFKSGRSATMSIKLHLKNNYINDKSKGFYPTNEGEEVTSKLPEEKEKEKKSTLTPVLKRLYNVVYDNNPPKGCKNIVGSTTEQHWAFENVNMKNEELTCPGYLFKGWKIVTENVQKVNSDTFQMPTKNVTLRAEWSQHSISKSMEGTVYRKATLYDMVKTNGITNNTIYTGLVTDEYNKTQTSDIYYYTNKNNNNVLYAGFCWQIVRTTTTGGVKLIYNGLPDSNGTCTTDSTNTSNNKTGVVATDDYYYLKYSKSITSEYLYADNFDYNVNTKTFTLKGNKFRGTYSTDSNKDKYIGKFTCQSINETCTNLYYISAKYNYDDESLLIAEYTIKDSVNYATIATSPFNSSVWSPETVGYMFNNVHVYSVGDLGYGSIFATDVTWNATTKQYELSNNTSTSLDNTHRYTCDCTNGTDTTATSCQSVRYYHYINHPYFNFVLLKNGNKISDVLYDMISYIDSSTSNKQPKANLNKYNSSAKSIIDWWFANNIQNKTDDNGNIYADYLEDIVFCNDRSVSNLAGWTKYGDSSIGLQFTNSKSTLRCPNVTDQFSTSNTYAKLKYPVGLLTAAEANKMTPALTKIGATYWLGTPDKFAGAAPFVSEISRTNGDISYTFNIMEGGLRPVVSLKPGTEFSIGDGTISNPYVIDEPSKTA